MISRRAPYRLIAAYLIAVSLLPGCSAPPPPEPLPPNSFAFGVFGDGPYNFWENGRFDRVLADVGRAELGWLIHVGDILQHPCTDAKYKERYDQLNSVAGAVIYTPGDNEWTDCHGVRQGRFDPLERLASLRHIFFSEPGQSLGKSPISVVSQASDPVFSGFPENVKWRRGGLIFATLHVVGSSNGLERFTGRTAAHDRYLEERTAAAIDWMDRAFAEAIADSAWGVVLALHADLGIDPDGSEYGFESFNRELRQQVSSFPGQVLLIHGDNHEFRLDRPLLDDAGRLLTNLTRLETFGSPDIGWVRIVVDTLRTEFSAFEPRLMKGWW